MFGRYLPGTALVDVALHAWSRTRHTCYTDSSCLALAAFDLDAGKVPISVLQNGGSHGAALSNPQLVQHSWITAIALLLSRCRPDVIVPNMAASIQRPPWWPRLSPRFAPASNWNHMDVPATTDTAPRLTIPSPSAQVAVWHGGVWHALLFSMMVRYKLSFTFPTSLGEAYFDSTSLTYCGVLTYFVHTTLFLL
jgi:hypothetical protein